MSLLISIVFSILVSIGLAFGKAISIYRLIRDQRYSWTKFIAISLAWLGATIPSTYSECGQLGCSWGLRFGWISDIFQPMFVTDISSNSALLTLALLSYLTLCIYFFGHIIGWVFYALSNIRKVVR